jgi:hypothetical protein
MSRWLLMVCAAVAAYGQTVSSITFDGLGDSSVRVIFNISATYNALRVRYGTSSCASGSGGTVQNSGTALFTYVRYGMTAQLSGLAPSTLYHVCPEVSSNGGSTWSNGADATFTTLPRTQTTPIPPAPVSTNFPAQTGTTLNVASNCSDLQAKINAAAPGDTIVVPAGTVCTGTYTTPRAPEAKIFGPAAVQTSTSTITLAGHGFTENQEVHFSTNGANDNCLPGMSIFQAAWTFAGYNCDKAGGWNKGNKYYVHVVDSSHIQILNTPGGSPVIPGWVNFTADAATDTITFLPTWATPGGFTTAAGFGSSIPAGTAMQFLSNGSLPGGLNADTTYFFLSACPSSPNAPCTTQVSLTSGGAPVNLTSAGSGVHTLVDQGSGTMYIAPAPTHNQPWIVIRTGGALPPPSTRISNAGDSQLFQLKKTTYDNTPVFQTGILAHNWRIVGALFNTATNDDYLTTTDPRPFCGGPMTHQDSRFIVFDQIRVQGPGYPNRFGCRTGGANMFWDGAYISVINSDMRGMDFWHSWYGATTGVNGGGLVPTRVSGTQVTATAGVGHGGVFTTTTTGTTTINFTGGSATGTAYVYFAMDGTMKVLAPSTMTGNCSASGNITPSAAPLTCTMLTAATPDWPLDANGRRAALALFTITLSAGSVTGVTGANPTLAVGPPSVSEGANTLIAGNGPGPYLVSNNFFSGAGLTLHFDDSGGTILDRGDYTVTNNYFEVSPKTQLNGPQSDGLWYGNRQPLEWKGGNRLLVSGNTFTGCYAQINNIGTCIILTPRTGGYVTDVDVSNNQFLDVGGMSMIASPIDAYAPVSRPAARQRFSNNVARINAWTHYVVTEAQPNGFAFYGGNATENVTISHNTIYDNRGAVPTFMHWFSAPTGGMKIYDNIYFYTNAPMFQGEIISNCPGDNKTMMDCTFTSGPGNPSYTFTGNLVIPFWADSSSGSGFVGLSAVQNALGSLASSNFIPTGSSANANLGIVKFVSAPTSGTAPADVRLSSGSPYLNKASDRGESGAESVGADVEIFKRAQRMITDLRALDVGSTSATISAFVPEAGVPCYVGYGTGNDQGAWTWTAADTAASRQRNIAISGLTGKTRYLYTMACSQTAAAGAAALRTQ